MYDIPQDVLDGPRSPAFRQFLFHWFGGSRVSFSERLRTAGNLSPEETELGRQLIRRNLILQAQPHHQRHLGSG